MGLDLIGDYLRPVPPIVGRDSGDIIGLDVAPATIPVWRTGKFRLPLRAGLHTGEIEIRGRDIGGIAVHAAARVMAQSNAGEVLVSRVVTDLVAGAGLKFSDRGSHELKGLPGRWALFAASI